MGKGVKKIKCVEGLIYPKMSTAKKVTIKPDQFVWFAIADWEKDTTAEDKKKNVTWMRQDHNRRIILNQMTLPHDNKYGFKITKRLSGSYSYFIEASLSGKSGNGEAGLYIGGYCDNRIVKSFWTVRQNSLNERENHVFSYGETIYLQLETEGLNGDVLIIEVYNRQLGDDKLVQVYTNVQVIDGEVNLKITNSAIWRGKLRYVKDTEEFYVKVKDSATGSYIIDNNKDTAHARFLRIKDEVVASTAEIPKNLTPLKVGKIDVNAERYEPCKFDSITVTEKEKKDGKEVESKIVLFEKGKKLAFVKHPDEDITKSVIFEFDSTTISAEGQKTLNNVLQFLLEHQHSSISLSGYACVIGKQNYNLPLSKRRADAVKKFFEDGKLDKTRIVSTGYGEAQTSNGSITPKVDDNKSGGDNLKNKNEKDHKNARRVDVSFKFYGHDAQTITYETIAPSVSTKKDLEIEVIGYDIKSCFRDKLKHKKETRVIDVGQIEDKSDVSTVFAQPKFMYKVYSDLSKFNLFPIQYIWPMATTPNKIYVHTHSCRYYSNDKNATLAVLVYPDIKWTLKFFLNLTNDLSVKWQNQPENKIKELQKKAGKIGAERRWEQKDASFGFSLKGEWDKSDSGTFTRSKEFKSEYETKFKKLYSLFSSVGAMSDGITNKTKGQIRNIGFKGMPMTFAVKPPNLNMKGVWSLERAKQKKAATEKLGTSIDISFNADPLIGLEITIDLLCTAVGLVAGAVSGGTAAPGAIKLYGVIKGKMNTGIDIGTDQFGAKLTADVYIDLVISSVIKTAIGFSFNTVSDNGDSKGKLELTNTLKIELKAGIWAKAEVTLVIVKAEGYFEVSGKGNAAVTFGHGVNYDEKGLYYRPKLGFDGLNAEYVIKGKVGLSSTKKVLGGIKPKSEDEGVISEGKYVDVIPKFDVIKSLEELFGFSADIPLIKN
jgi:outer membrane protein OmpA-like peptidoglycan-associated protein